MLQKKLKNYINNVLIKIKISIEFKGYRFFSLI